LDCALRNKVIEFVSKRRVRGGRTAFLWPLSYFSIDADDFQQDCCKVGFALTARSIPDRSRTGTNLDSSDFLFKLDSIWIFIAFYCTPEKQLEMITRSEPSRVLNHNKAARIAPVSGISLVGRRREDVACRKAAKSQHKEAINGTREC
jgi:hypothetical protein